VPGITTTILLARHGRTADNANHVFQGQGGRGLDELGRAQAHRLAARIARAGITAVVSSDLDRAVETARLATHGLALELATDAGLREIDVGTWTGKSYREIEELYPEQWAAWTSGLDVRRGGGETYGELADRLAVGLARVADANPGGRVLVVTHGGAIRSWVSRLLGLGDHGRLALGSVANTSLTTVERTSSAPGWRLRAWNDTAHLEDFVMPGPRAAGPAVTSSD
jgi:broad specificity phosphatase PhoE